MRAWTDDAREALRALVRRPLATLGTVTILALGLGAAVAVFSLLHAVLLAPLPFRDADRLVRVESVSAGEPGRISLREVLDLRAETDVFAGMAGYVPGLAYTVSTESYPEELTAVLATQNLFSVLGVELAHGEAWPEELDRSRSYGLLLGHAAFQRNYGGDPAVVGSTVTLDGVPDYRVYGVLPPGIDFPARVDLYRSIFLNERFTSWDDRDRRIVVAVARLAPGVSVASAQSSVDALVAGLAGRFPDSYRDVGMRLVPLRSTWVGPVRPHLLLLAAAVTLLLVLACANAASLLLVRGLAREGEMALRSALGAGRLRLVRQLLFEGVLQGLVAAALGVAVADLLVRALVARVRFDLPVWMTVAIDPAVLGFAVALALLTGMAVSLVPALRATATSPVAALQGARRGGSAGTRPRRLQDALLAAEAALSVVLLLGCGLTVRSLAHLLESDPGFRPAGLLTFRVSLTWFTYRDDDLVRGFQHDVLDGLARLPGVESAALDSNLPMARSDLREETAFLAEGQEEDAWRTNPRAHVHRVSSGYLSTMGIPLLAGRDLGADDRVDAPPVALVSASLAKRLWPAGAVGRRLRLPAPEGTWREVVGVVGDTRQASAGSPIAAASVYLPAPQPRPPDMMHFVVRTRLPPLALRDEAVSVVRRADPDQAVYDVATMEERLAESEWQRRVSRDLLVAFAVLAVSLALAGMYAVVAYLGRERRRELGIRAALGAGRRGLVAAVAGRALVLAVAGTAAGVAAGLWLARFLAGLLFEVSVHDAWTFVAVPLALVAATVVAAVFPALRASRLEANRVLRDE